MNFTIAPNEHIQVDDARITYKNFSGKPDTYTREGERSFTLVIPSVEIAEKLREEKNKYGVGWNVKIKPPRTEDEEPFCTLKVKVKFTDRGPNVYMESGRAKVLLTEDTIGCLDRADITRIDLDIRPYDDEHNGRAFRSAYLHAMYVVQEPDRFAARFAGEEYPEE